MPTTTVATLVDRAKAVADMRDNFVTPTQWITWATQERLALDFFLARSGWTIAPLDFDIAVDGTEAGVFPVDPNGGVMAIVCVYQYDSSGRIRMLRHKDHVSFIKQVPGTTGRPVGNSSHYRVTWSEDNLVLNLFPEPATGETYNVVYIAHPRQLVLSLTETDPGTPAATAVGQATRDGMNVYALWNVPGTVGNGHTITFIGDMGQVPGGGTWVDGEDATYSYYPIGGQEPTVATFLVDAAGSAHWTFDEDQCSGSISYNEVLTLVDGVDEVPAEAEAWEAVGVSYPLGWEERIVLGMARRALIKEESDTRGVDSEIQMWDARIEEACWNRVLTSSPAVRNVDNNNYGWTDRYNLPPFHLWSWP